MNKGKRTRKRAGTLRVVLLALAMAWGGMAMAQTGNLAKIDPELQEQMHQSRDASEHFRVIVEMMEQYNNPNLERGTAMMTRAQRRDYVVNELKRFSEDSQAEMVGFLTEHGNRGQVNVLHRFWIFNGICCEATADCIGELSMRQDVRYVALDAKIELDEPIIEEERENEPLRSVEWHVSKVRADEVWNYPNSPGYTGAGVIVAILDTGVNYNHNDISDNMWDGGNLYPHHGWDFVDNDNDPMDEDNDDGHGSHVAGIVASHGLIRHAGIAPGATIMAIRVVGGNNLFTASIQGFEFAIEHGADVMNASWFYPGPACMSSYRDAMVNSLLAGVVVTKSAGNVGHELNQYPRPNNITAPGGCPPPWQNHDQVLEGGASALICVGNTTSSDKRHFKSSIGPVTWANINGYNDYPYTEGSSTETGLIRPDVSAPGTEIRSIRWNNNTGYHKLTGTSMAAPCVAGVIALMLEANPNLTPEQIDMILETTAVPCENLTRKNNYYGAGRVDAFAAVTAALSTSAPHYFHINVEEYPVCACSRVLGNGDYLPNSICTIEAIPAYHFLHWEKNGEVIPGGATLSFPVTEDACYTAVFFEYDPCYYINMTVNPVGAAEDGSGWGYYYSGRPCTLSVTPKEDYVFINWTKNGEVVSTTTEFSFVVSEDATYVANFKRENIITVEAMPTNGGNVEGGGTYLEGDQCTVTATPNVGYAFLGWYNNSLGTILYSLQPQYAFTVTQDRNLVARFVPKDYTVTTSCSPSSWGSVMEGGTYPANSVVTVTATPASGHFVRGWMENGVMVSNQASYTFTISSDRELLAVFGTTVPPIVNGSVVTNADGSKGVVFYTNPMGTGGTMVALEDVSTGCTWGNATDINALRNYFDTNSQNTLNDMNGYANTEAIRNQLGTGMGYAADVVDFANGWYLPSANQLRKIYGALPFIESAIESQGGTLMTENSYWSSTEFSYAEAWNPIFAMGHTSKTSSCRVRAVRDFSYDGNFTIMAESSIGSAGAVGGSGVYADGAPVTVVAAVPSSTGYTFNCWKEDGVVVSRSQVYTFTAHSNRHLVAEFRMGVNIGTVITNADGTKGVVFYTDETGTSGTMVALEDVSTGCAWGDATDINPLHNFFDSYAYNSLNDMNGYANTEAIRNQQGAGTGYAADVVDFANGWYLPSANQLRKIYGALPFIEEVIVAEGGTVLTENSYWSSTEYSFSDAWNPAFAMGYTSKTSSCRVRAVRDFSLDGTFVVSVQSSVVSAGAVAGSGVYDDGAQVTVLATAPSNSGYVFHCWKENGIVVSMDPVYTFTAHSNRNLIAEFVIENSIGCVVTNPDGTKGVVFYTDPSGATGWMVALENASEGCPWGDNQNVVPLTDYNPNQMQNLLEDLSGYRNTQVLRGWFMDNTDYAASKVDFANGWYLPSAGQLRKLYAALPFIEDAILREGGTTLTDGGYWSSTECSDANAWSPAFAFGNTNKSSNLRVRAIHDVYLEAVAGSGDITFVGTVNSSWSEVGNWINNEGSLPSLTDDVVIAANCVMNMNATVKSVTLRPRSELTVTANHCLNVTESISNSAASRIILEDGAQLVNPTESVYVTVKKNINGYGNNQTGNWYTISTPIVDGSSVNAVVSGNCDLFCYDESIHYWLNQKDDENDITNLIRGYGFLYASQESRTVSFTGQANASSSEFYVRNTNTSSASPLNGFNLIGNPFTNNINISSLSLNGTVFTSYYKVKNGSALLVYTDADQEPIRPAEGFFVQSGAGYVCYNTPSRGEQENGYVRLVLNQGGPSTGSGADCLDRAYLKMNEGEALNKAYVERQPSLLYFNCSGQNYAVASQHAQAYNLCFETEVGGVFTIESSLLNTECGYLHLVDRLAGEEVDLLATPTYSFAAAPADAPNRFVLVLVEGAQPEEYVWARNRDLLPMLPIHYVTTNQPAYIDYVTKTTALDQGWTWWAPEVRASVPEIQSALGSNMQEIRSQEGTPSGNVVPGQMFRICTTAPCSLALTGLPVSAAIITINPGYNWIGYFGEAALITQVFNGFMPATGDKIIAQDEGFAIYNGTAWEGTLTTLQPGHGYVYVSNASEAKTVVFE